MTAIEITYLALLVFAAVPAALFPFVFHMTADWKATQMGKHLMSFMVVLAVILGLTVLSVLIQFPDWFVYVALLLWLAMGLLLWQRVWLLLKAQGWSWCRFRAEVLRRHRSRPRP